MSQDEFDLSALQARYERTKGKRKPPAPSRQRSAPPKKPTQASSTRQAAAKNNDKGGDFRVLIAWLCGTAFMSIGVLITLLVKPSLPSFPSLDWQPAPQSITLVERIRPNTSAHAPSSRTPALGVIVDCEVHTANFEETLRDCLSQASPSTEI